MMNSEASLEILLSNARKSRNATWSQKRINDYRSDIEKHLIARPELHQRVDVIELLSEKQKEIDAAATGKGEDLKTNSGSSSGSGSGSSDGSGGGNDHDVKDSLRGSRRTMATQIPLPPFYKKSERIEECLAILERYFKVAKTLEEDRKDLLLYVLASEERKLKEGMEGSLEDKSYEEVKEAALQILGKQDKQAAYLQFFTLQQQMSQTPSEFAFEVKAIARRAGINDAQMINTRIVTGLRDQNLKFEMLKNTHDTFEDLLKVLNFMVEIRKVSSMGATAGTNETINYVKNKNKQYAKKNGKQKDKSDNKNNNDDKGNKKEEKNKQSGERLCFFCKKPGHMKKNCFSYLNKKKASGQTNAVSDTVNQLGQLSLAAFK